MHYEPPYYPCGAYPSRCTPVCGDGVVVGEEGSEAGRCDDRNLQNGDGCDSTCAVECGWTCSGGDASKKDTCSPTCGDGLVAGTEECDDGDKVSGDGCDSDCNIEPGWACSSSTCSTSYCSSTCGDGILVGHEECDDGNYWSYDGCSSSCNIDCGYTCTNKAAEDPEPSECATVCGDGMRRGLEECDDFNTVAGDGCSSACSVESEFVCGGSHEYWRCGGPGDRCQGPGSPAGSCGSGSRSAGSYKECDDGNLFSGDGCSQNCQVSHVCVMCVSLSLSRSLSLTHSLPLSFSD